MPPTAVTPHDLDAANYRVPYTHRRACHLLYHLVSTFQQPNVLEVACCFGKATVYLAAAAKRRGGRVRCVDIEPYLWEENQSSIPPPWFVRARPPTCWLGVNGS
jgi:predicted O-methyltransferase YrrM